ncbi:MAG: hypothetical protein KC431_19600, partial [Myxococcales bacterium]|nr:hypothetical protein [Myxococcales bacterium]
MNLGLDARAALEMLTRVRLFNDGFVWRALVAEDPQLLRPALFEVLEGSVEGDGEALTLRIFDVDHLDAVEGCLEALFAAPPKERLLLVVDLSGLPHDERGRIRGYDLFASLNGRRDLAGNLLCGEILLAMPAWLEPWLSSAAPDLASVTSSTFLRHDGPDPVPALDEWWKACGARFEDRLTERSEAPARYQHGTYTFAYALEPGIVQRSLAEMLDSLTQVKGYTGWRPWWVPTDEDRPKTHGAALECWMFGDGQLFPDPAHSDFWRASGQGCAYLRRGYEEDSSPDRLPPGRHFSNSTPIWRLGEALLHARDLATLLALEGHHTLAFRARWQGLAGRTLTAWPEGPLEFVQPAQAVEDAVTSQLTLRIADLHESLPKLVDQLTTPL